MHAVVAESEGWFVAECLEVAVVTQGRTLDETLANLRSALALHLDDEELSRTGLSPAPRLAVSYETSAVAPEWRARSG
ncbi:MAG: type II toxin-antitoxin system HicB family antitoxin [Rhodospirillaceae bacterium]|nr:type II toxin-antitoxin system HicB family antitoxin [Rhodospirillaceae bacterium]MYB14110.1 type II toxin-antitoxin system HicB family antitoxin [Rhodospirillaceae bacterium]MYI49612.1 type II toxin-antitoxin system HicB family antitoxin [Rhodospirillaceae bacterium]